MPHLRKWRSSDYTNSQVSSPLSHKQNSHSRNDQHRQTRTQDAREEALNNPQEERIRFRNQSSNQMWVLNNLHMVLENAILQIK